MAINEGLLENIVENQSKNSKVMSEKRENTMGCHRSFILLGLALCVVPLTSSYAYNSNCRTSNPCSRNSISDDCGNGCSGICCMNEAHSNGDYCNNHVSTFFLPRPILTDLTYRNNIGFYQRYHDACCSFFTYESTLLYQRNRHAACVGLGYFGKYPMTVSEINSEPGDINSLNLFLSSNQPQGFLSTFHFRPKRSVLGWMPQLSFNFDCFCTGLWADITTAVLSVHNEFCLNEKVVTPGDFDKIHTVQEALFDLKVFPESRRHTGADNVELRLGYDLLYCDNDHIGLYLSGIIPTGSKLDNSRWFQPLVGTRAGAFGFGLTGDCTLWDDEVATTVCVVMSELKYLHFFKHKDRRMFDLVNGPLSRFLLVTQSTNPLNPSSGTRILRECVEVKGYALLEWWLSLHYHYCGWGFEAAYNLFVRDRECIAPREFCFGDYGIYYKACNPTTSESNALIYYAFGQGTPDESFVPLTGYDVNINSAQAGKAVSSTLSASVSYNSTWRDYPFSIGMSASYEVASKKHRTTTLENWGVFGVWSFSV